MRKLLIIFTLTILFLACEENKETPDSVFPNDTEIVVGSVGGWCYGSDSLVINNNNLSYYAYAPCEHKTYHRDSTISDTDLQHIYSDLNMDDFRSININTCNTCVDGVDFWIRITDADGSHTIRYGYQDAAVIEPVYNFVEKVNQIRENLQAGLAQ
ncbi:MAG: hypothetical protein JXA77_04265 [Bacteroidales bacterium]|nr:hypothetical protein [Bacteroidales bacterium]MBN2819768.1 hypothetical protein [Bacteroidales bacterium]